MKSKKGLIKLISIIAAGVIAVGATLAIVLPSFLQHKQYTDAVNEEKSNQEYLDSLPLTLNGITAQLNDDMEYFSGETPSKGDFLVKAQFSERGKDFERILTTAEYDISVPETFASEGGNVTVSYTWTPQSDDRTPVTKTAQVNVTLTVVNDGVSAFEAEGATASGGEKLTVQTVEKTEGGDYENAGEAEVMQGFGEGDSLSFTAESVGIARAKIKLYVANNADEHVDLKDVIDLKVNGKYFPIKSIALNSTKPAEYAFVSCNLPDMVFKKGQNTIELSFKAGVENLAFDRIDVETLTRGSKISSTIAQELGMSIGEYAAICAELGTTAKLTAQPITGSNGKIATDTAHGIYAMGGASDGEYYYFAMDTTNNLSAYIYKVDAQTLEVVARTKPLTVATGSGDNARLFIKDGLLYCVKTDGSIAHINLEDFEGFDTCEFTDSQLSFSEFGTTKSAYFVQSIGKFAVVTYDQKLFVVGEDGVNEGVAVDVSSSAGTASSVAADDKFIYVNYSKDAAGTVAIDVFTFDGVKVTTLSVGNFQLFPQTGSLAFNTQALFFHNGVLNMSVCGWGKVSKYYHDWTIVFA